MTPDVNPYEPPKSQLNVDLAPLAGGALEDAIAGRYDFRIGQVMDEAWQLVKGFKASFWGAMIVIGIISAIVQGVARLFVGPHPNLFLSTVVNIAIGVVLTPLNLGIVMMAVRRASGRPAVFATAFSYFHVAGAAMLTTLIGTVLTYVGMALLLLPGLYLAVAYVMASQLVADRGLRPWQALETSRKAITHKWFRIFFLGFLTMLLVGLSALPLGIPLIWTLPWGALVLGVLFRRVFGTAVPPDEQAHDNYGFVEKAGG